MADFTPAAAEGENPTQPPTPGQPGIGFDDTLPAVEPASVSAQITEVDWPPAVPQGPRDPADTPGWKDADDLFPATEDGSDAMDPGMDMPDDD